MTCAIGARRLCFVVLALLTLFAARASASPPIGGGANALALSEAELNLGIADPGAEVEGALTLVNAGHRAIGIAATLSSCTCTVANISPRVADPGQSMHVTVSARAPNLAGAESTTELRFTTTEGQELIVPVRIATAPVITAAIVGVAQLRDGQIAWSIRAQSLDETPFQVLTPDVHGRGTTAAAAHRLLVPARTLASGAVSAVVELTTDRQIQPTVSVAGGALLESADLSSLRLHRAAMPTRPSHVHISLPAEATTTVQIELPGWTDPAESTRLAWTNTALALELKSLDTAPAGAVAVITVQHLGPGRRSVDVVRFTSPSFEATIRVTVDHLDGHD